MKNNKRLFLGSLMFVLWVALGYQLYELAEQSLLWGWLTLPFVLLSWGLIVVLRWRKYNPRWFALSSLSGVLLSVGFVESVPNIILTPLLFFAFVPLLLIEREIFDSKGIAKREVLRYAFHALVIWNIGATWWVCNSSLPAGMIANFLNALFMALMVVAWHQSRNLTPLLRGVQIWLLPIFWVAFEYLHLNWELTWSWLTLGNAFANLPSWIQWYEWTGTLGGSLWIWAVNILVFQSFIYKTKKINILLPILKLFVPILCSWLFFNEKNININDNKKVKILAIQPNFEPHYQKFNLSETQQVEKIINMARQQLDTTFDYLVLPETIFDRVDLKNINNNSHISMLHALTATFPRLHIVTGIGAFQRLQPSEVAQHHAARLSARGGFYYEAYNAATQLAAIDTAQTPPFYFKSKLVPGPEILPFKNILFFLKPLFDKFQGSVEGLGTQTVRSVFQKSDFAAAPVICYESIFGEFCTGYVRNGANAIFVMTNDGWWDDTPGYRQHLQFARLRAIELRRFVIRSTNTGASALIDANGKILAQTKYDEATTLTAQIPPLSNLTFYARFGDWIGKTVAFLAVLLLIATIFKTYRIP